MTTVIFPLPQYLMDLLNKKKNTVDHYYFTSKPKHVFPVILVLYFKGLPNKCTETLVCNLVLFRYNYKLWFNIYNVHKRTILQKH